MSEQVFVNRLEGLKEAVKYGRLMGHVLQEYSSLKGNPDLEISTKEFKTWIFNIDGYDVQFYFNRVETDYFETERNIIETLQIWSDDLYFLPFVVSFKITRCNQFLIILSNILGISNKLGYILKSFAIDARTRRYY